MYRIVFVLQHSERSCTVWHAVCNLPRNAVVSVALQIERKIAAFNSSLTYVTLQTQLYNIMGFVTAHDGSVFYPLLHNSSLYPIRVCQLSCFLPRLNFTARIVMMENPFFQNFMFPCAHKCLIFRSIK